MKRLHAITDVSGGKVGHASALKALTGFTVILFKEGADENTIGLLGEDVLTESVK